MISIKILSSFLLLTLFSGFFIFLSTTNSFCLFKTVYQPYKLSKTSLPSPNNWIWHYKILLACSDPIVSIVLMKGLMKFDPKGGVMGLFPLSCHCH